MGEGDKHEHPALPLPPLIYLGFEILGFTVNLNYPLVFTSSETTAILGVGLGVVACAFVIGAWALLAMRSARVSALPWKQPAKSVVGGPFQFSRNPIYVSLAMMYIGISVAINTIWPLVFLPFAIAIVDRGVILQEERFLEKKFGEEYLNYKARVRRWI